MDELEQYALEVLPIPPDPASVRITEVWTTRRVIAALTASLLAWGVPTLIGILEYSSDFDWDALWRMGIVTPVLALLTMPPILAWGRCLEGPLPRTPE